MLDARIVASFGDAPPDPPDFEILVDGRPDPEILDSNPRLRTLIIPYAGLPAGTRTLLRERPHLSAHNLHHNAGPAAELAMALLLAAAKRIVPLDRRLRAGDWRPRYEGHPALLLEGKRALVLGYGAIGRRVARMLGAFGMEVHALRRRGDGRDGGISLHGQDALRDLLPHSQVIALALPLTERTSGMIGEAELGLPPAGSVLVHLAPAQIVDERALSDALESGRLGAAGLDVWYRYPGEEERADTTPSELPFQDLENVVMSPHRGGAYRHPESERLRMEALARSLNAAARGEMIPHQVDPVEGY